jgi:hypothetical protein
MSARPKHDLLHAAAQLSRLVKICGVFGSDHDGERAAAAAMADKIVRDLGCTWSDIISPKPNQLVLPDTRVSDKHPPLGLSAELALLRANLDLLTPWERRFVFDLGRFRRLSPKQRTVVARLVLKVRQAA